ncbi:MAG: hypothetical protein KGJ07_00185 [Patescibacteria group bacterium]|nr:hypothetical protein [Patescibacteria group bacterium]
MKGTSFNLSVTVPKRQKISTFSTSGMSPLAIWWHNQSDLRAQGLINEIDLNEIIAAARGVRNKWFVALNANLAAFKAILEPKEEKLDSAKWNELLALRDGKKLNNANAETKAWDD